MDTLEDANVRFLVEEGCVTFDDLVMGLQEDDVALTCGDFVLKRKDGYYAYQLAVVVDDILMGITEVIRGADLLSSTGRQIQLFKALNAHQPLFGHVPLVLNAAGIKLSKRDQGLTLKQLREEGVEPQHLVGFLAFRLGLIDAPAALTPTQLIPHFSWENMRIEDFRLPDNFSQFLRKRGTISRDQ